MILDSSAYENYPVIPTGVLLYLVMRLKDELQILVLSFILLSWRTVSDFCGVMDGKHK